MIPVTSSDYFEDIRDRSARRHTGGLCMTPTDTAEFSAKLKIAIPAIRFVSEEYWQHFVDRERYEGDRSEYTRRRKLGLAPGKLRRYMREPAGEALHYWANLADPAETRFIAWIEPPNWVPVWGAADEDGIRRILNEPRLWFSFRASEFRSRTPGGELTYVEPEAGRSGESLFLSGTRFEVRWNPAEPEAESFGKTVYNVLRRSTTSRFVDVEQDTRKAFTGKTHDLKDTCLAGYDAVEWAMKRRHNYLWCGGRGVLKPAGYPFRPRDVFSKTEWRKHLAASEKTWKENTALYLAEFERVGAGQIDVGMMDRVYKGEKLVGFKYLDEKRRPPGKPLTRANFFKRARKSRRR